MPAPPLVEWPDLPAFKVWLGEQNLQTTDADVRAEVAFTAAWQAVWDELNPGLLAEAAYPYEEVVWSDPPTFDENGEQEYTTVVVEAPDETCRASTRQAIFIQAGRLFTRRDSLTGIFAFAEYGVRLSKLDPDVHALIRGDRGGAEP